MKLRFPVDEKDHVQGNPDAPIKLVEYGDYQCPYCAKAYYEMKKVQEALGNQMCFVFRNFPLTNIHRYAMPAAVASEAADAFGKFWPMHDLLFENQRHLTDTDLVAYAEQLGINPDEFATACADLQYREKIDRDLETGLRSGVNQTPSFYINGQLYNGDYSTEVMVDYLRNL